MNHMQGKPSNLKELIQQGYVFPAWLPEKNDFLLNESGKIYREKILSGQADSSSDVTYLDLGKLDQIKGYFGFLTEKDYGAISPLMWNTLFERKGLNLKTIYFVSNPKNAGVVVQGLKEDPKYLGGGFGSGWKEKGRFLDRAEPEGLVAVNNIGRDSKTRELIGYNTDVAGFLRPLKMKFDYIQKPGLEGKNLVLFGAGGVSKELTRELVRKGIGKITIINRTISKAEDIAQDANQIKLGVAEYAGEHQIRSHLLRGKVDAIINASKKGAEPLEKFSAFAQADIKEGPYNIEENNKEALWIGQILAHKNPSVIVYDITLPRSGFPKTLELAQKAGLKNLIDGKGMVINQSIVAIKNVEKTNPGIFGDSLDEKEVERIFGEVA